MNRKSTFLIALSAGLMGGLISTCAVPTLAQAQTQQPVPKVIAAHNFVLVDERGHKAGEITMDADGKPNIKLFEEIPSGDSSGSWRVSVLWNARGETLKRLGGLIPK